MKLAPIPAGKFMMGLPDEPTRREVTISKACRMSVHEVTQGQYEQITGTNPSWFSAKGGGKVRVRGLETKSFPVEMVSWYDAVAYCKKLSDLPTEKKARRSYRLPTEAEWEYACRAGTKTLFHGGNRLGSDEANFNGYFPHGGADKWVYLGRTNAVGSYAPNAWGLYDMHGNVWEWCADKVGENRALRGGSWYGNGRVCQASHRASTDPKECFWNIGFRVVCEIGDER
jgi:formylglycine-generating enzyme required for sulfatase activity